MIEILLLCVVASLPMAALSALVIAKARHKDLLAWFFGSWAGLFLVCLVLMFMYLSFGGVSRT
jgi:hypothetical protein